MSFRPRLLRETAEIALTELKRFIEPRLAEDFSLRRVSAPLFLHGSSPLLDPRHPGARITLPGISGEVEIVGSLDVWMRGQLARYDIASGFGVFTIMNAIRPGYPMNSTSSPHVAAWTWQQAIDADAADTATLVASARKLYAALVDAEKMLLEMFPHLTPTLRKTLDVADSAEIVKEMPQMNLERCIYEYLHPGSHDDAARHAAGGKHCAALLVIYDTVDGSRRLSGEIWVWNRTVNRSLRIADLAVWDADGVAGTSVGGNIYRDYLALQLLHQDRLLG